jgi:hypothetical protein
LLAAVQGRSLSSSTWTTIIGDILGSHSGEYEDDSLLRYSAVNSCSRRLTFQRCVLPLVCEGFSMWYKPV